MNKQEAIEKIKSISYDTDKVIEIVEQIDEPQKPVIPQFVADWIEECKESGTILMEALNLNIEINTWLDTDDNEDTFARAWLDGYEIEQEQLYTVEIPNRKDKLFKYTLLGKDLDGDVFITKVDIEDWKCNYHYQLTEEEIKEDFEWAWQFAKPVPKEVE